MDSIITDPFDNDKFDQYLDQLADLIFDRIIRKYGDIYPLEFTTDQEEIWVGELARLNTVLEMLEDREEYEKCSIIKNRIRNIEQLLKNL